MNDSSQQRIGPAPARRRAFTLIELLIVVAIIGVLAAIAVPNMLEAQTRAKVSRVQSDLRVLGTALEAYRVDATAYPIVGNPMRSAPFDLYVPYGRRLAVLTTPVAYISNLPLDPFFKRGAGPAPDELEPFYAYCPGNLYHGAAPIYSSMNFRNSIYSISGRGPDRHMFAGGYCLAHPAAYESGLIVTGAYDPTNGTISEGDIYRLSAGTLGH